MTRRFPWLAMLLLIPVAWLAGCASGGPPAPDGVMLVRGELASRARIALPPDAVAIVELTRPSGWPRDRRAAHRARRPPGADRVRTARAARRAARRHRLRAARRDPLAGPGEVAQRSGRRAPGARRRERRRADAAALGGGRLRVAPRLRAADRARRHRAARRQRRDPPDDRRRTLRDEFRRQRLGRALRGGGRPDHAAVGQGRPRDADAARRGAARVRGRARRAGFGPRARQRTELAPGTRHGAAVRRAGPAHRGHRAAGAVRERSEAARRDRQRAVDQRRADAARVPRQHERHAISLCGRGRRQRARLPRLRRRARVAAGRRRVGGRGHRRDA